VALVLLIGCVNVIELLLARASRDHVEMAVAPGAWSGTQAAGAKLLTESLCFRCWADWRGGVILFCCRDSPWHCG